MKRFTCSALLAVVIGGLAACGGSDSSSNGDNGYVQPIGGEGYVRPIGIDEPVAPVAPATLALEVTVNGAAATPNADGQVNLKSEDLVIITPNQSVSWIAASVPDGAVIPRDVAPNPTKWSAQIVNASANVAVFTVRATSAADASQTKKTEFKVAAPIGN
jgi:hypothetical protein